MLTNNTTYLYTLHVKYVTKNVHVTYKFCYLNRNGKYFTQRKIIEITERECVKLTHERDR